MAKTTNKATKKAAEKKTEKKAAPKAAKKVTAKKTSAKTAVAKKTAVKKSSDSAAPKKVNFPEAFTATSIVSYVAEKHDIPKTEAKGIVESVFDVIQAGVLSGARVPLGKFGKMYVKVRPARKARKGRNPITGEEMTIPAKKATKVPKFTFSKTFKEESLKAKVK